MTNVFYNGDSDEQLTLISASDLKKENKRMKANTINSIKEYYHRVKKMQLLLDENVIISDSLEKISHDIATTNVELDITMKSMNYDSERVTGTVVEYSEVEKELVRKINELENTMTKLQCKKEKNNAEYISLKIENYKIEVTLNALNEEHRKILEYKFKRKYTSQKIAFELSLTVSTINRMIDEVIKDVGFFIHNL